MDGSAAPAASAGAATSPAPLRHLTLRVEHDCPLAELSRELPGVDIQAWSTHRLEVVEVRCTAALWPKVEAAALRLLKPLRVLRTADGGLLVWEPLVREERSVSRILEAHRLIWLQPMRVRGGWEHYDAIGVGDGDSQERAALHALAAVGTTQVVRRRPVAAHDLVASLFLSLRPVLDAPTDKQAEALLAAAQSGYYRSPREATTAEVAQKMGLGRSAFEERLRGGENRLLAALAPALEAARAETGKTP
ncbi:MAG TPA: helix-turn-helix domain-containing protein [Candidatus Thermoplasmatota archaeon]|nr:helix-turn-helix domain-containing protein [Candidatus Thermoplasmatota archaeon]